MADETLPPVIAQLLGDVSDFIAKLQDVKSQLATLTTGDYTATLDVDNAAAITKLEQANVLLDQYGSPLHSAKLSADDSDVIEKLTEATTLVDVFTAKDPTLKIKVDTSDITPEMALAATSVEAFSMALDAVTEAEDAFDAGNLAFIRAMNDANGANYLLNAGFKDLAEGGIANTEEALGQAGGAAESFGSNVSPLISTLLTLAPLIATLGTVGIGVVGALGASFLTLASGVGAFGLAAEGSFGYLEAELPKILAGWQQGFQSVISPAILQIPQLVSEALSAITPLIAPAAQAIGAVFTQIGQVLQSSGFQQFIQWLAAQIPTTITLFAQMAENFLSAFATMAQVGTPFMLMIEQGMLSLTEDLDRFASSQSFQTFINYLIAVGPEVATFFANLLGVLLPLIEGFAEVGAAMLPVINLFLEVVDVISRLDPGLDALVAIMATVIGTVLLASAALGLFDITLTVALGPLALFVVGALAVAAVAAVIIENWSAISDFFRTVWDGLSAGLTDASNSLDGWITDASNAMDAGGESIMDGLGAGISDGWNGISGFFNSMGTEVIGWLSDAGQWLIQIGEDVIDGLLNGMIQAWNSVFGWLNTIASQIEKFITDPLEIFSPSRVMASHGQNIMLGLAQGLQQGWTSAVVPTMQRIGSSLSSGLTGSAGISLGLSGGVSPLSVGASGNQTTLLQVTTPIQVSGQTLASTVTTYQLRGARSTGTALGQYAGGSQTQTATGISPNAVQR